VWGEHGELKGGLGTANRGGRTREEGHARQATVGAEGSDPRADDDWRGRGGRRI